MTTGPAAGEGRFDEVVVNCNNRLLAFARSDKHCHFEPFAVLRTGSARNLLLCPN